MKQLAAMLSCALSSLPSPAWSATFKAASEPRLIGISLASGEAAELAAFAPALTPHAALAARFAVMKKAPPQAGKRLYGFASVLAHTAFSNMDAQRQSLVFDQGEIRKTPSISLETGGQTSLPRLQELFSAWVNVAGAQSLEESHSAVARLHQDQDLVAASRALENEDAVAASLSGSRLSEVLALLSPGEAPSAVLKRLSDQLRGAGKSEAAARAAVKRLQELFMTVNFAETAPMRLLSTPGIGYSDSEVGKLSKQTIANMYAGIPLGYRLRILGPYVQLPNGTTDERALFCIVKNSGPAVQKLMQLLSKEVRSRSIREGLAETQDNLGGPIAFEERDRMTREAFGRGIEELFKWMSPEPVASATLGVVHKAVYKDPGTGEEVSLAVKFLRPGIEEALEEEIRILYDSMSNDFGRASIRMLERTFTAQLSFVAEARGIMEYAPGYILPEKGLDAVRLPESFPKQGVSEKVLATVWIEGTPLSRFASKNIEDWEKALGLLIEQYRVWFDRALVGDGKMHGDPHGGNDQFDLPSGKLTLMDFGSFGQLTPAQQDGFFDFLLALKTSNAGAAVEALALLQDEGPLPDKVKEPLVRAMAQKMKSNRKSSFDERMEDALAVGMGVLDIPSVAYLFHRGVRMFRSEIRRAQATIKELGGRGRKASFAAQFMGMDVAEDVELGVMTRRIAAGSRVKAAARKARKST
ncbi:MAG: hypothetical protein HY921_06825 [Elusimicrobia bacterium]|nr:hypothetical protein [Elusimicrobiota bacterium]